MGGGHLTTMRGRMSQWAGRRSAGRPGQECASFLPFFSSLRIYFSKHGQHGTHQSALLSSRISGPCSMFFISDHSNTFSRKSVRRICSCLTLLFPNQPHLQNISKFHLPYLQMVSRTCLLLTTFLPFYSSPSSFISCLGYWQSLPTRRLPDFLYSSNALCPTYRLKETTSWSHLSSS